MTEWKKAIKKPVEVEFREVESKIQIYKNELKPYLFKEQVIEIESGLVQWGEKIQTLEGVLYAICDEDFIIRGVKGEIYPIKKDIFYETYEVINK